MTTLLSSLSGIGVDPKIAAAFFILTLMMLLLFCIYKFCAFLLPLAKTIDRLSTGLGIIANWLVLFSCLISAGNATLRYAFTPIRDLLRDESRAHLHPLFSLTEPLMNWYGENANGFLEAQWYMFAGMVLFGASYTLRVNEHVRVDLFYGAVSDRVRHWIDLLGGIFFLMPMCVILIWFTWPWFVDSYVQNESSNNAGGLLRWPVKLLLPLGFFLLAVQGFAEMIKRSAALKGIHNHEFAYEKPLQ